jgi:hypothetical protein
VIRILVLQITTECENQRFGGTYCLHNTGNPLPDYTLSLPHDQNMKSRMFTGYFLPQDDEMLMFMHV